MKSEALVWALLFILAVGLASRLFFEASRRTKRADRDPAGLPKLPSKTAAAPSAPREAPEPARLTTAPVAEPAATWLHPSPSPQPVQATVPSQTYEAPTPVLPTFVAAAIPPRDRTVIAVPDVNATLPPGRSARPDTVPRTPDVRTTLPPSAIAMSETMVAAPDVKATLHPVRSAMPDTVLLAPDVRATLPPAPIAMSDMMVAAPDVKATLPPAAIAQAVTELPATVAPSTDPSAVAVATTIRLRGTRLRARRIGQAMPPLDERIKETRSRKLRRRSKTRRKLISLTKTPRKAPPRRIAAGPKGSDAFASTKAETKIVDAPPKEPRVRIPTVH